MVSRMGSRKGSSYSCPDVADMTWPLPPTMSDSTYELARLSSSISTISSK
ncbi:MAG: hypothetical protein V8S24_15420 [Gordonibacter pamelaeae]